MEHIKANSTTKRKNSATCNATEYDFPGEKDINSAVIELTGRYPETGFAMNTVCKELIFVIEGEGNAVTTQGEVQISTGDMVMIQPNDKYYLDGKLKLLISSSPAWYPEQYVNL